MAQELTKTIIIESSNIKGKGGVDRLEGPLSGLEGVRDVEVDPDTHTVQIVFDPMVISALALQSQVEDLGYEVGSLTEKAQIPL